MELIDQGQRLHRHFYVAGTECSGIESEKAVYMSVSVIVLSGPEIALWMFIRRTLASDLPLIKPVFPS